MSIGVFQKICSQCNVVQIYGTEKLLRAAIRLNKICVKCALINRKNARSIIVLKRFCPRCGTEILYKSNQILKQAIKRNSKCMRCCNIGVKRSDIAKKHMRENHADFSGKNNSFFGKHHSESTRLKISKLNIGKWAGDKNPSKRFDIREKHRQSMLGDKNPSKIQYVRDKIRKSKQIISSETRRKMRLARIKQVERNFNDGNQISPSFNPIACKIIDEYGKQNGYNFQHAMNGGEFYIKELGYWLDGYDKEKNTAIEYYEKFHEKKKERDEIRKKEIIGHLNCNFIEIKE